MIVEQYCPGMEVAHSPSLAACWQATRMTVEKGRGSWLFWLLVCFFASTTFFQTKKTSAPGSKMQASTSRRPDARTAMGCRCTASISCIGQDHLIPCSLLHLSWHESIVHCSPAKLLGVLTPWSRLQPPKAAGGKGGKDTTATKQKASKEGGGGKAKKKVR
jgi:hypothetical protein